MTPGDQRGVPRPGAQKTLLPNDLSECHVAVLPPIHSQEWYEATKLCENHGLR